MTRATHKFDVPTMATLVLLPFLLSGFSDIIYSQNKNFFLPFQIWSDLYAQHGLVEGYYLSKDIYPPGTFLIIAGATDLAQAFGGSVHDWYKGAQIAFFIASLATIAHWRVSSFAIVALSLCLFINSIVFESADIFYTFPLLIAICAFLTGRYALFSATFALACLIKWQPIIAAPFFGLHFILSDEFARSRAKMILQKAILPSGIMIVLAAVIFGPAFLGKLFSAAGASVFFSGNALNFNYALGWLYGAGTGMVDLSAAISPNPLLNPNPPDFLLGQNLPPILWVLSKAGFLICSGFVLFCYLRSPKTRENAIYFGFLEVFTYVMLMTEVHENHLHLGVVLLAPLFDIGERYRRTLIFVGLVVSTNLMLYFSPWRDGFYFVSFSLLIALCNVAVWGFLLAEAFIQPGSGQIHLANILRGWRRRSGPG